MLPVKGDRNYMIDSAVPVIICTLWQDRQRTYLTQPVITFKQNFVKNRLDELLVYHFFTHGLILIHILTVAICLMLLNSFPLISTRLATKNRMRVATFCFKLNPALFADMNHRLVLSRPSNALVLEVALIATIA